MNGFKNINSPHVKPAVLMAPLDWGLGHATRLIPLIKWLENKGVGVILGAAGRSRELLIAEFPHLPMLELPAYNIRYSGKNYLNGIKILTQVPGAIKTMQQENKLLEKYIGEYHLRAVISDNRPGLYSARIHCIYLTHQIEVRTGMKAMDGLATLLHRKWIKRFDQCWVPDEKEGGLAGELSHPKRKPSINLEYIGCLSRYALTHTGKKSDRLRLLILLSGPEPQRSILERILMMQMEGIDAEIDFVRGLPGEINKPADNKIIRFHNHLSAAELGALINDCNMVIARCGYSTVMDLALLQKKAILIPTPGQGEQEYLSEYLMKNNFFYCVSQSALDLKKDLLNSMNTNTALPRLQGLNEKPIEKWCRKNGLIS